jgi:hypothetical protein
MFNFFARDTILRNETTLSELSNSFALSAPRAAIRFLVSRRHAF